ncbi:hypothetical protein ACFSQT_27150 [Mesorhizobium calcicola]|uniref:Uncharacterized protein n=1 Tax=Mesorhizobium calcicola TaxID=1300310 RepID=A0ABW4WJ82_9HYPH
MAYPFGGHPRLADYIGQARQDHGATCQSGTAADSSGKAHAVSKIKVPSGKSVVVVGMDQTDHLTPSMVGYLDRRLEITSPWFSVDPGDNNPFAE